MRDKGTLLLAFNWFSFITFMIVIVVVAHGMYRRIGENSIDHFTHDTVSSISTTFAKELAELNDQIAAADDRLSSIHDRCRQRLLAEVAAPPLDTLRTQAADLMLDTDDLAIALAGTNAAPAPMAMTATGIALRAWSQLAPRPLYLQLCLRNRALDSAWDRLRHYTLSTQMEAMVYLYLVSREDDAAGRRKVYDLFDLARPVDPRCARHVVAALDMTNGFVRTRAGATTRDFCFAVPGTLIHAPGTDARIVCRVVVDIEAHAAAHTHALKVLGGLVLVFIMLSVIEFVFLLKRYVRPLYASGQMLETVLDTIPVPVFWKDTSSRYLGCNRRFAHSTGLASPKDIAGKTDYDLGGREFAETYRADDRTVIESGVPTFNYEEPSITLDGQPQWLRSSKAPLRAPSGTIIGVLGTFEDITAQKQATDNLLRRLVFEKTLGRLSACLLDTAGIPSLIEQSLGEIAAVLQVQAVRVFTYPARPDGPPLKVVFQWCAHEALNQRDREGSVPASDRAWIRSRITTDSPLAVGDITDLPAEAAAERAHCARSGVRAFLAVPLRRLDVVCGLVDAVCCDGPRVWRADEVDFFVTCVQIISGAIERHEIYCALQQHRATLELTVQGRTEELVLLNDQLRLSEALYFSTISSLHDWLHVIDRDMRILFANEAYLDTCKKFGFDARVVGADLFELMPFLEGKVRKEYEQVFASGTALVTQEETMVCGCTVFTKTKKTPVFVDGVVARVVTFMEDITKQKMRDQALRESETRYRALFDGSPVAISEQDWSLVKHCLNQVIATGVADIDSYLTQHPERVTEFWSNALMIDANPAMQQMHGVESKDQLLANVVSLFPPEAFDAIKAFLLSMARGEQEYETETIVQPPRCDRRHVAVKWRVVPGYESTYGKVVLSFIDITERTRAENLVHQSEQKFSATFQLSPALMAIVTRDTGVLLEVNDAYVRNSGYQREELVGKTAETFNIWSLEQREAVRAIIQRDGSLANYEIRYRTRDGSLRTGLLFAEPLDLGGRPCLLTMAVDITERGKAEEQKARFVALVESSHEFVGMATLDGQVIYLNRAGREMVGLSPDDDVTHTLITDYVPEDRRASMKREIMTAVRNDGVWQGEGQLCHFHAHTLVDVAVTTFLVPAPGAGAQACIATVMRNISARKRADAQIHKYEHQLRAMASQIPLAEERERRRIAAGLHDDVCQTLALTNMKLGMARFGVRQARLRDEIASSVESAIASLRSLMFDLSPPALYELGLGPALEWLADRVRRQHGLDCVFIGRTSLDFLDEKLRAILYLTTRELVMNVIKHAHARRATITADSHGGSLCIVVADNGRGITPGAQQQETFGLFSVRERLRNVGGTLDIQSRKGKGTTAVIAVPLPSGAPQGNLVQ